MLEVKRCNSFLGSSHILHDLSCAVGTGEVLAVLGRNGVGKTTLLKTLMGQTNRQTGEILLDGEDISSQPTHLRARAGLGYVPQGREIIPGFTVEENILMGCFARKDKKQLIPDYVWDLFPMLKEHLKRQGSNLSGGQQQQLAIARALASDPQILLLDEPTEGIQPNVVEQIQLAIGTLNRELGITVVLVEQKISFAKSIATKFVILEKGAVAAQGAPDELTDELVHEYMTV